jgi:NADPH2:quinone reductase
MRTNFHHTTPAAVNAGYLTELMQMYGKGQIKPYVSETFGLDQAVDAMNAMAERRVTGKVVLLP